MYKGEFKEDKPCGKGVFEFSSRNRQAGQFLMSQVPLIAEDPEAGMKTEVKWDGQNVVSHVIDDGTLPPGTDDDETLIYVANPVSFIQDRADRYGGIFRTKVFGSRAIGLAGPDKYEFVLDGKHFTRQGASPTHIQQLFGGTDKTPPIALAGPEQSVRKEQLVPAFNRPNTEKYMRMIDVITASHVPQWEQAGSFAFKEKLSGLFFEIAFKIFGGLYDEVSREHLRQLHETWSLGFTSPVKSDAFTAGLQARDELLSIFSFSLKAHSEGKTARWQPKPPEKPKETTDGEEEEAAAEQEGGLEDGTGPISEVDEEAVQKEAVEAEANGGSYGEIPPFGGEGLEPNGLVEPEFQPLVFDEQLPGQPPRDDAVFSLAQIAVKFGIPFEDMSLEMLYLVASCQGPLKVLCTDLFLALAQNPDVLEKAQREVRRVSASGPITIEQLNQIRYLEQVTHEVRRFYPTIPVQFFRTTQQVPIEDFRIPSGWLALAGVAAIHQDVSVWADPKKFDPERFTNEANSARRPFAYLPQGAGPIDVPQRPPSDDFTTIAMKVVAIHLLRKYDWQLDEEQPLELDFKKIIPAPTSGVLVKLERSAGTEEEEEEEQDIGPSMPPGLKKKGQQEEEEEEEKKDIGPSIPPSHRTSSSTTEDHRGGSSSSTSHASSSANRHAVEKSAQPMSEESSTTGSSAPKKRLGPSLPPVDWRPPVDEDDLIGPRPSMGVFDHMDDEEEDEEVKMEQKRKREHAEAVAWCKARGLPLPQEEGEKGGREEWMTALPAEKNPFLPVGPVIQTRGFSRKEEAPAKQDTSWTDTPADRARKAKEAALAKKKKRPSEDIFAEVVSKSAQRADQEVATNIDAYNSVKRPKSLLEEHAEAQKKNPKKDEYVGWDRDRDFTSRPIDPKTRNKMIKESKGLNGMFNLDTRKFL
mmetsp:Transcript_35644/g.57658  ORF Transcript_35644/g.57658 Transcript_35644/m.57658 type:complete len:920 (-) Transcript_35644:1687-4446(-)